MSENNIPLGRRIRVWILYLPARLLKFILFLIVDVGGRLYGWSNPRPRPVYRPESAEDRISRLSR